MIDSWAPAYSFFSITMAPCAAHRPDSSANSLIADTLVSAQCAADRPDSSANTALLVCVLNIVSRVHLAVA
jgi:hypothetical protein